MTRAFFCHASVIVSTQQESEKPARLHRVGGCHLLVVHRFVVHNIVGLGGIEAHAGERALVGIVRARGGGHGEVVIGIVGRNAALQVAPAGLAAGIDGILCYPPPLALDALEGEMSA